MAAETNEGQRAFWTEGPGQVWANLSSSIDVMFAGLTDRIVALADPRPGEVALDIGCASGALTAAVAKRVGVGGKVVGLDISETTLGVARDDPAIAALPQIELLLADAQTADFPTQQTDLVVSRFGVMFFDDPVAAFANIRAAMKPGGRMVLGCWAGYSVNPWFKIPRELAIARMGAVPPSDPRAPGPTAFAEIDYVCDILTAAGFVDVRGDEEEITISDADGVDRVAEIAIRLGPVGSIARENEATDAQIDALAGEITEALGAYASDVGFAMPGRVILYQAKA